MNHTLSGITPNSKSKFPLQGIEREKTPVWANQDKADPCPYGYLKVNI